MNMSFQKLFPVLFVFCLLSLFSVRTAFAQEWREVTPAELQQKSPKVEPDADAEVLFWEVRVDDGSTDLVMKHYVRVKIFTERGREKYSKIDIPFTKGVKIKNIMARVIKSDGTTVDLSKEDIFDREIAKTDKIKVKAKSFAVPNIEPGVIVEYRYQETHARGWANNMRMVFQHDVPIQTTSYYFKPALNAKYLTFNMDGNKFIKDKNGFYRATMENVPAIKEEAHMPPEDEVRSWLILYYWDNVKDDTLDFWSKAGGVIARNWDIKDTLKPGKEIKAAAAQIVGNAATTEEKLARLYEFCKTKIKNIDYDPTLTDEQKEEIKPNKSTADTYRNLRGTSTDINELFASLATALGYEARLAFGGDRSEKFFDPQQAHVSFVHFAAVAVKTDRGWQYFDPGSFFTPYGMLPWHEENTSVLLLGYKDYLTTQTPISMQDKTVAKRVGRFTLLEDGTLEGIVRIEYTGHLAAAYKLNNYKESANKREEDLKEEIRRNMTTAEISDIQISNVDDPEKPFIYNFKVRVPNYAQRTGKRLFLQPGFFEYGKKPVFASSTRKYPIYFHYPWSEQDDIEIKLPQGFKLDNADAPAPISDPSRISWLSIEMGITQDGSLLRYNRKFHFGGGGKILFPTQSYQPLKNLFDAFHKADSHTITLKQD
jgi:Transglutaminase-like enzymes, putative cysteine proteases